MGLTVRAAPKPSPRAHWSAAGAITAIVLGANMPLPLLTVYRRCRRSLSLCGGFQRATLAFVAVIAVLAIVSLVWVGFARAPAVRASA